MTGLRIALEALDHHIAAIEHDTSWSLQGRIGSALLWVCALDEAFWPTGAHPIDDYEKQRDQDSSGMVIVGLRRARDAVTHRLVRPSEEGGLEYPLSYPLAFPDVWVPLAQLGRSTSTRAAEQERVYVQEIQGRRVREPLDRGRDWLARYVLGA